MELIDRVRAHLPAAEEKRMFGGTGFMVEGALACSASERGLLVRVGADAQAALLEMDGVRPMVKGGRTSRGWVHVQARVIDDDSALREWLERGVAAARASLRQAP